jgi:hypothetical protein
VNFPSNLVLVVNPFCAVKVSAVRFVLSWIGEIFFVASVLHQVFASPLVFEFLLPASVPRSRSFLSKLAGHSGSIFLPSFYRVGCVQQVFSEILVRQYRSFV